MTLNVVHQLRRTDNKDSELWSITSGGVNWSTTSRSAACLLCQVHHKQLLPIRRCPNENSEDMPYFLCLGIHSEFSLRHLLINSELVHEHEFISQYCVLLCSLFFMLILFLHAEINTSSMLVCFFFVFLILHCHVLYTLFGLEKFKWNC